MTHDELVKFAAEKVGGIVDEDLVGSLSVKLVDEIEIENGRSLKVNNFFYIDSPDLFFKGLAAAYEECSTIIYTDDILMQKGEKEAIRAFNDVCEIPQKFWECWAELEGIGNLTKEGV